MNRLLRALLTATGLLLLAVPVYAVEEAKKAEEMTVIEEQPEAVRVPSTFGSSRLHDWHVLDSRNLVIELDNGKKYRASLMNACHGLRFTDTLGFSTQGPYELDKWTTLHLPDGERCHIRELTPYKEADRKTG